MMVELYRDSELDILKIQHSYLLGCKELIENEYKAKLDEINKLIEKVEEDLFLMLTVKKEME